MPHPTTPSPGTRTSATKSVRRPKSFYAAQSEGAALRAAEGSSRASPALIGEGQRPSFGSKPSFGASFGPVPSAEIAPPSAATAAPEKAGHPVASTLHGPIQAPTTPAHRARPSRSRERSTASAKASPANPSVVTTTPVHPVATLATPVLRAASTPPSRLRPRRLPPTPPHLWRQTRLQRSSHARQLRSTPPGRLPELRRRPILRFRSSQALHPPRRRRRPIPFRRQAQLLP